MSSPEAELKFEFLNSQIPEADKSVQGPRAFVSSVPISHETYQPKPDTIEETEAKLLKQSIFLNTQEIEKLYLARKKKEEKKFYEALVVGPLRRMTRYWFNELLLPPGHRIEKPLITLHHIQSEAGKIGGELLEQEPGLTQSFFWMQNPPDSPAIGELVFIRHQIDPKTGMTVKVDRHIHYAVSKSRTGDYGVTKYFGSDLVNTERSERIPVVGNELKNIEIVTAQFVETLKEKWEIDNESQNPRDAQYQINAFNENADDYSLGA